MPILEWSETQPRLDLPSTEEFDHAIDRLSARCTESRPTIVAVYAHGHQLMLGIGLPQSFVQVQQWDDAHNQPALITVGDATASGQVAFYFLGSRHTEIPQRNLIPSPIARQLAKQFLESGKLSPQVAWEPV